jgi:transcriptional regulator with XRE-family HTH domain
MPESTNFPDRLALLRSAKQLSQPALATAVGLGKSTIQKWEAGENEPMLSGIRKLAAYFGCTCDYLMGASDHPQHLRPGDWLVDLAILDDALAGKPIDAKQALAYPIPARHRIVTSSEYAALLAQATSARSRRKK